MLRRDHDYDLRPWRLFFILAVLVALASTGHADVNKNTLTPAAPPAPECGDIWLPPCGDTPYTQAQHCCYGTVNIAILRGRIVTIEGKNCKAKLTQPCEGAATLVDCNTTAEVQYPTGGGTYDLECRN